MIQTSVTSYSFGRYFGTLGGICGLIDKAAELGFEGFEFLDGGWADSGEAELNRIGAYCREKGLEPIAFIVGCDFVNGKYEDEIAKIKEDVDKAAALGVKFLRHDVVNQPRGRKFGIGYDDVLPIVVPAILEITKYAEQKGVQTLTENHGYFSQDAARFEKLINAVAHPNFGALVDIGNFMCADEDPWKSVGVMAPYAKHVHAKDFFLKTGNEGNPGDGWFPTRGGSYLRGTIIGHGDARVCQSIQTLKRAGYDGFITIEFEGMEDNLVGLEDGLENLKKYIAM
ncbi:MAG: sugar phosphate isomerase/epimerase [Clostridia bacterium]|nr:sugar phosphate isomerase/epimerase [Clostridia bacterium]